MDGGVHENATFAYHGFNGLIKILDHKSKKLECAQLRGLNRARGPLVKDGELSEYKRIALVISSGNVGRVKRVIVQGLTQKKGIRGIMASLEIAAQEIYHPKKIRRRGGYACSPCIVTVGTPLGSYQSSFAR